MKRIALWLSKPSFSINQLLVCNTALLALMSQNNIGYILIIVVGAIFCAVVDGYSKKEQ